MKFARSWENRGRYVLHGVRVGGSLHTALERINEALHVICSGTIKTFPTTSPMLSQDVFEAMPEVHYPKLTRTERYRIVEDLLPPLQHANEVKFSTLMLREEFGPIPFLHMSFTNFIAKFDGHYGPIIEKLISYIPSGHLCVKGGYNQSNWIVSVGKWVYLELSSTGDKFNLTFDPEENNDRSVTETQYIQPIFTPWESTSRLRHNRSPALLLSGTRQNNGVEYGGDVYLPGKLYFNSARVRCRMTIDVGSANLIEFGFRSIFTDLIAKLIRLPGENLDGFAEVLPNDMKRFCELIEGAHEYDILCFLILAKVGNVSTTSHQSTMSKLLEFNYERERRRGRNGLDLSIQPLQLDYLTLTSDDAIDFDRINQYRMYEILREKSPLVVGGTREPFRTLRRCLSKLCGKWINHRNETLDILVKALRMRNKLVGHLATPGNGNPYILVLPTGAYAATELYPNPCPEQSQKSFEQFLRDNWDQIEELTDSECFVLDKILFQRWYFEQDGAIDSFPCPTESLMAYARNWSSNAQTFLIGQNGNLTSMSSPSRPIQGLKFSILPFDWQSAFNPPTQTPMTQTGGYLWAHFEENYSIIAIDWKTIALCIRNREAQAEVKIYTSEESQISRVIATKLLQETLMKRVARCPTDYSSVIEPVRRWCSQLKASEVSDPQGLSHLIWQSGVFEAYPHQADADADANDSENETSMNSESA